ncbi:MAG: methylglyoxal synthase [Eubacteriales bacterium]|nr:methylglyoxal synthase [Eubacteriales bacterium]
MKIILMADQRKYDLLVNFCIAYKQILKKQELSSQFNLSRQIFEACELPVETLASDRFAQLEQLASKAHYNELDAIIYLRDPQEFNPHSDSSFDKLARACDANSIPYATNLATAELLILAIDRGDLDWRDLVRAN